MAADNVFSDLSRMIEQLGKDKGIEKDVIVDAVVQGLLGAARKKYGTYREIEAQYNDETGEVELFEFKEVVEEKDFQDDEVEIILPEALKLDPEAQIGDQIGMKMETKDLGRIAIQTARQAIIQKVRDAEREIIYAEFEQRRGDIASGIARRVERGAIVVDLGRTEAHLPMREQIPGEIFKPGDRIQGYILDVRQTTRGPQIIMSRSAPEYLVKLFEMEVPEIPEGIVEVKAAAREPGSRAKIAVISHDAAVDPVGACVGMKGSRVQNIVQELRGERIDIVPWDENISQFAVNALAPAEVAKVFLNELDQEMEVIVPDHQLSLAIGKRGQNVRLAAKITGWKIDIVSETSLSERASNALQSLLTIPGVTETEAQAFYQCGFDSFQDVADAAVAEIMTVPGFENEEAKATKVVEEAQKVADTVAAQPKVATPKRTEGSSSKAPSGADAKTLAEMRLKQEFAQLNNESESAEAEAEVEAEAKPVAEAEE